jgi:hypothetical protein
MFKKVSVLIVFFMLIATASMHLEAGFTFGVDTTSRVIWRGLDLFSLKGNNDKPALQPNIKYMFGKTGFSLQLVSTLSLNKDDWKRLDELDVIAAYDFNLGKKVACTLGFIHYGWYFTEGFTFRANTFQELYFSAGLNQFPLEPRVTFYYYIHKKDESAGWYALAQLGHVFHLTGTVDMKLWSSIGYNNHHRWITGNNDISGFNDLNLGISFPITCNKISVKPFLKTVFLLEDKVNPGVKNETWFGVSMVF